MSQSAPAIKVMVVDDSAVVRQVLVELLGADPGVEVIAAVADPLFAMQRMKAQWPDVIVLDVEMPRMDGVTFLRKLMHERPTPVVICSTLTEAGASTTIEALAAGAVTVITKPKIGLKQFLNDAAHELLTAVKMAARANVKRLAARAEGVKPAHVEGYDRSEWILLDYFDFIVHVFAPDTRVFYGLERLWGNAERIEIDSV